MPRQERGQRGVGPLKRGDIGQPQLLVEAVLEGAPEALDTTLGLGRASADPGDAEFVEDAPDLSGQRFPGELLCQCEGHFRFGLEDLVAVAVKGEGKAASPCYSAQEQKVALGVFLLAEGGERNIAGGVVNPADKSEPGAVGAEPLVTAAVDLQEHPGLRPPLPA